MRAPKNDKFKDYTHYAEYCLNAVASTRDQELRCAQREMAAEWLRLADLVRRPHKSKQMQADAGRHSIAAPREPSGTSAPLQCGASFCADAIQSIGSPIDNRADLVDGLTFDCALATDAVAIPPQGSSDQSFAAPRLVATGQQQIKCVAAKSAASTGQRIL